MAVGLDGRVEPSSELVLGCWRDVLLALEDDDLMLVQGPAYHFEVDLADVF